MAVNKNLLIFVLIFFTVLLGIVVHKYNLGKTEPPITPPGQKLFLKTKILKSGAIVLQNHLPVNQFNVHMVGFHPMKHTVSHQMEAHHYCHQVNEDFAQCILFDSNTANANLTGVEYIISEKLYQDLPEAEKVHWHPHNFEVMSGQLNAPGIPVPLENSLLKSKINSYGKTWHTWMTNKVGQKHDDLPFGEPMLGWSFNHDGEINPKLISTFEKNFDIEVQAKRERRADLTRFTHVQEGVDALHGQRGDPTS